MAPRFGNLPYNGPEKAEPFTFEITDSDIDDFNSLLALSKIGPATWENQHADGRFGITRKWLDDAKTTWLDIDWRAYQDSINAFPNYKMTIDDTECGPTTSSSRLYLVTGSRRVPKTRSSPWATRHES
ncbi:hypothetical protein EDB80DRAFT_812437 [Ilyonectria destructans]|nr:hypothetical protein EDB80DRAFT_812437 [Ilyonectria destructans]